MSDARARTTRMFTAMLGGDGAAADELFPLVYTELRNLAGQIAGNRPDILQPTDLIHEAYLRLVDGAPRKVSDRVHFKRLAARAMRGVMVDHARAARARKRGGARQRVTLDGDLASLAADDDAVLEVEEGMQALREVDPELAELIEMRFFGQMSMLEIAAALGVSESTVHRSWRTARAWWMVEYSPERSGDGD